MQYYCYPMHMKKYALLFIFIFSHLYANAQTKYATIERPDGTIVQLKIQLPRNYDRNKQYPVIVVLDGDYLFEPVAGISDYYTYWDDMPPSIVVGINQSKTKSLDFNTDEVNELPSRTGLVFFEFLYFELLDFIDKKYQTTDFRTIIGHGYSANFLHFYLFKENPVFNAYIAISPKFTPKMNDRLQAQFSALETPVFYALSTSNSDSKKHRIAIDSLHKNLDTISNKNFRYQFNSFDKKSHYQIVSHAIPTAFESFYDIYSAIDKKEYNEKLLPFKDGTAHDYLIQKYDSIQLLYQQTKKIRVSDYMAAQSAILKKEDWETLKSLAKRAKKDYPGTMLSLYYTALFHEKTGHPKKAIKAYNAAYIMEEIGQFTKEDMLYYAEQLKADFGY